MIQAASSQKPIRFLVVEDDTVASIDLECILEDLGHSVTAVAATRKHVRERLSRYAGQIDAAIVDSELIDRSARALVAEMAKFGIVCAIAGKGEKPFTADGVVGMLERLRAG